ncbi:hypothetical protein CC1G_13940 [Coprinopsis cinerea okayama7|uniref:Uncharacterized protein n=1 Tax=Coprinopsis cinerea (strain Okayama-7 / 130 / ATCC MYA-4618 / FGSC 9003) TaxID=240176 RepID=D6RKP8_COPC7|nr:hypothetical protein CC1G_13940 [Coprinopsis cinerea okayama7\|eukprot:XP_002911900.1 hypothetical protein CC1G_13940 [Coprinopsis cinerea okayama7\
MSDGVKASWTEGLIPERKWTPQLSIGPTQSQATLTEEIGVQVVLWKMIRMDRGFNEGSVRAKRGRPISREVEKLELRQALHAEPKGSHHQVDHDLFGGL